jgi:hypothetical protein
VEKFIWDFETWEKTFRSANDKHHLTDFDNNPLTFMPVEHHIIDKNVNEPMFIDWLHNVTTITDAERNILADFFMNRISILNRKLLLGNVNNFDFAYLNKINKLLKCFNFESISSPVYSILQFTTKDSQHKFISKLIDSATDGSWTLKQYLLFSDSLKDSATYNGISLDRLNSKKNFDAYYVVVKLKSGVGIDLSCIPHLSIGLLYGIKLYSDFETDMYNSGKTMTPTELSGIIKTNTVVIEATVNIG